MFYAPDECLTDDDARWRSESSGSGNYGETRFFNGLAVKLSALKLHLEQFESSTVAAMKHWLTTTPRTAKAPAATLPGGLAERWLEILLRLESLGVQTDDVAAYPQQLLQVGPISPASAKAMKLLDAMPEAQGPRRFIVMLTKF